MSLGGGGFICSRQVEKTHCAVSIFKIVGQSLLHTCDGELVPAEICRLGEGGEMALWHYTNYIYIFFLFLF